MFSISPGYLGVQFLQEEQKRCLIVDAVVPKMNWFSSVLQRS